MRKKLGVFLLLAYVSVMFSSMTEAKTKSLQEIEGDRVVVLKIDKKAKLPKKYIKKKKAAEYIGSMEELKEKVTTNLYSSENVIRHAKSDRYLNISDGIYFNTDGGKIGYVSRKDGAYTIIVDYPQGRKLEVVDDALFEEYANYISDELTVPYVFFDKDGNEAAIAFLPPFVLVYQYITTDGLIAIKVKERI